MAENLLTKLGGQEKVDQLVEIYFERILEDPRVRNRYLGRDLDSIKGRYKRALGLLFSGDTEVLTGVHTGLGITSEEFNLAIQNFDNAARELNISYDNSMLLISTLNSVKDRLVGK
mmetsp:Transcript_6013/g.10617  ORF Transcript_6013/g.10617 Transcript_6013/m.10617 type:complete len:116 (-) Transcript_6013:59-406(-)